MDKDQIKSTTSMIDVIARYGFQPNKSGFICCPFHQEKTASLKIYPDSFHCFGCHANGDIFKFVMLMEECDFKKAYSILGGTYDGKPMSDAALSRILKRKADNQTKQNKKARLNAEYVKLCEKLHYYQKAIDYAPKDSDIFAEALKEVDYLEYQIDYLFDKLARKD